MWSPASRLRRRQITVHSTGEIRHLLAQQMLRHTRLEEFRDRTARLGALTADRPQTDSVSLVREDRDR